MWLFETDLVGGLSPFGVLVIALMLALLGASLRIIFL